MNDTTPGQQHGTSPSAVLIWGAGAVGGTIGAWLARAGHSITLVDPAADHVRAIRENGLHITGPVDDFTVQVAALTPDEVTGTYSTVLLCVKAHHTAQAATMLRPTLAPDGYVVSVQNGLNEVTLSEVLGEKRVIGAFVNFGADVIAPGVIQRGNRAAVVLGELDGRHTPRLSQLHRLFLDFEDQAMLTENIWGYLWGKSAYGAQLFATALTPDSIADALANPAHRTLYIEAAREVLKTAHAHGITPEGFNGFDPNAFVPGVDPAISQASLDAMVAFNRKSAKTHSGIWRDLAVHKRRTEVDAQLGVVVALAERAGLPTPLLRGIIARIHAIENGTRGQSRDLLDELITEWNTGDISA